jgi:alanyl-tRNA synthetase
MILMAWEFCLKHLEADPERIWASITDDEEAYDSWIRRRADERIVRYGEEENYWFAGDVGPCGPDSELYYDFGEEFGCGPDCHPAHTCLRFLEFWNLVFMTYYCDGEKRDPLPQKNIDTGAGVERQAIIQLFNTPGWDKSKVPSAYDTELFMPVIRRIEELSGKKYNLHEETDRDAIVASMRGRDVPDRDERTPVVPSNEERVRLPAVAAAGDATSHGATWASRSSWPRWRRRRSR